MGIDVGDEDYADSIHDKCAATGCVSTDGSTVLLLPSLTIDKRTTARGLSDLLTLRDHLRGFSSRSVSINADSPAGCCRRLG